MEPKGHLARWILDLQEYSFSIFHRPRRLHNNVLSIDPTLYLHHEQLLSDPVSRNDYIRELKGVFRDIRKIAKKQLMCVTEERARQISETNT